MPSKAAKKSKRDALKRHGTLNPHPNAVTDPLFQTGDFFDRDDLVQVKYEMLGASQSTSSQSLSPLQHSASPALPSIKRKPTFSEMASSGYCPRSEAPARHKLTSEVLDFAMQLRTSDPSLRPLDLAAAIQERFAINVHPRSIERALRRQEKKRR